MNLRKVRTDAWGAELADEVRWEIYRLTRPPREGEENRPVVRTFEDACRALEARGITPPSRAGWFRFLARMRQEDRLQMIYAVSGSCETAGDLTKEAKVSNKTAAEAFRALAVDAAMGGDGETANLYKSAAQVFLEADLKDRAQRTKDEQLALAREKFAAAEKRLESAKGTVLDERLTPEEKLAELDKLFGK